MAVVAMWRESGFWLRCIPLPIYKTVQRLVLSRFPAGCYAAHASINQTRHYPARSHYQIPNRFPHSRRRCGGLYPQPQQTMSGELDRYHAHESSPARRSQDRQPGPERETQQEALARVLDHVQYARGDSHNLPPELRRVIELLCLAQESLLHAQQKTPQSWDRDGHPYARAMGNLKEQAIHQIDDALREIKSSSTGSFIDTTTEPAD